MTQVVRFWIIQCAFAVAAALIGYAYYSWVPAGSSLERGIQVDGGGNPDDDMLSPGNRGDVIILSGNNDFTKIPGKFSNVETLTMRNAEGSIRNSSIILDVFAVIKMAKTGNADPADPGYGKRPALHIDGDSGDRVYLKRDRGDAPPSLGRQDNWLQAPGNGENGVPAGYDLYVHVTDGTDPSVNENAYLLIERGIKVVLP